MNKREGETTIAGRSLLLTGRLSPSNDLLPLSPTGRGKSGNCCCCVLFFPILGILVPFSSRFHLFWNVQKMNPQNKSTFHLTDAIHHPMYESSPFPVQIVCFSCSFTCIQGRIRPFCLCLGSLLISVSFIPSAPMSCQSTFAAPRGELIVSSCLLLCKNFIP